LTPNNTPPFSEQLVLELQHGHLEDDPTPHNPMTPKQAFYISAYFIILNLKNATTFFISVTPERWAPLA
jgi:hypothetical protein